jgi:cyclophilin family peptidyl-prolyl cis-trans isomerase/HEAT repeat protein
MKPNILRIPSSNNSFTFKINSMLCRLWMLGLAASLLISCGTDESKEEVYTFSPNLRDPLQQSVLDLQDRLQSDSLMGYLGHPDPTIRYRAAMAFASVRDSTSVHNLGQRLSDEDPNVRYAAAYALGQTNARQAEDVLINGFDGYDSTGVYVRSNAAILESVGKAGGVNSLSFLSTIGTYGIQDSLLILGQARGIYRFALRGLTSDEGTNTMIDFVASSHLPRSIRTIAANYLHRARNINTDDHIATLIPIFVNDPDPRIRMCLATALGKSRNPDALATLKGQLRRETDYRVKCNIIRAFSFFRYSRVSADVIASLDDNNLHVAVTAADHIVNRGTPGEGRRYRNLARQQRPWEVKARLFHATDKHLSRAYEITKGNMHGEMESLFRISKNPYEKAAYITAFSGDATNYQKIFQLGFRAEEPVVRTNTATALGTIATGTDIEIAYGPRAQAVRSEIVDMLVQGIQTGDVALIAEGARFLGHEKLAEIASDRIAELNTSLEAIQLPDAIESYNALANCIAGLQKREFEPLVVEYNHPIDWSAVTAFRDTVGVEIVTDAGTILAELFPTKAPGSVLNFVQLARDRFYNGKNFHRVVPNFVIQGGCPRGDGYGSLDYTIRSELPPQYYDDAGYLGMASAGNHTECTQWFITHSPTPHLDGNYTIFGKVISGMDVVHSIQIGDEIREVNVIN